MARTILAHFDADGAFRWGRDHQNATPLDAQGGVVLSQRIHPDWDLEHVDARSGAVSSTETPPDGLWWAAVMHGRCDAGCTSREARVLTWHDHLGLGALGSVDGTFGLTVTLAEDGVLQWHWSTILEEGFNPLVIVANGGVAPDGAVTIAMRNEWRPLPHPVCLDGVPCLSDWQNLVLRLDANGRPEASVVIDERVWSLESTDDGGVVVSTDVAVARYDASMEVVWRNDQLGAWVGPLALDRGTGLLRAAVGVPPVPIDLGGTVVHDCVASSPWAPEIYVLVTLDPDTGTVQSVDAALRGRIVLMRPHPDHGIVVALSPAEQPASSVDFCGQTLRREDDPSGPIQVVVAHID